MNADLHHQLRTLFDTQANDIDPIVPDRFHPARRTALTTHHRPDRRRPLLASAAAIALVTACVAILVGRTPEQPHDLPGPDTTTRPTPTSPTTTTATTTATTGTVPFDGELGTDPLLPEVFPAFASDDPLQATAAAHFGRGDRSTGTRETRALVGRVANGMLAEWVVLSVYDDIDRRDRTASFFPDPFDSPGVETVIGGVTYEIHETDTGLWGAVVQGVPDVALTGFSIMGGVASHPADFVRAAGGLSVEQIGDSPEGGLTFSVGALPGDFVEIAGPSRFPWVGEAVLEDSAGGATVTTKRFSDLMLDPSALVYPMYEVDVNGVRGWARDTATGDPTEGVEDFVVWPVAPGTWATVSSEGHALDVARSVVVLDEASWQATYGVTSPVEASRAPQRVFGLSLPPERLKRGGLLFLPNGRDLLVFTSGTDIIVDGETGQVLHTFGNPGSTDSGGNQIDMGRVYLPSFSPDGTRYADSLQLWDVDSERILQTVPLARSVFSPDGRWMASIVASDDFFLYDAQTGAVVWRETSGPYGEFWFTDDSRRILMVGGMTNTVEGRPTAARSFDVATGMREDIADVTPPTTTPVGFAADPSLVAQLDGPFDRCLPIGFWGVEAAVPGTRVQMPRCVISPDGSRIAMLDADAAHVLVWELAG